MVSLSLCVKLALRIWRTPGMQLELYLKQNQSVLPPIIFTAFVQDVSTIFTIIRTDIRWFCIFVNLLLYEFCLQFFLGNIPLSSPWWRFFPDFNKNV